MLGAFAGLVAVTGLAVSGAARSMRLGQVLVRLQDTTAEIRVRFAVLLLVAFTVLAERFGLESILGAFLAGAMVGLVDRDSSSHPNFRVKLEAIGYGFLVPVFFVTSGIRLNLTGLLHSPSALARVPLFLVALLLVRGLPALLGLRANGPPASWTPAEVTSRSGRRLHLAAGQTAAFALQCGRLWESPLTAWDPGQIAARLADTMAGWRSWSAIHQTYEGPWRDLLHHSGRVLQALTFAPTGAIVAAPTTSLPETIGGERNWDYRFPQAFSHIGLVNAAWAIARAQHRAAPLSRSQAPVGAGQGHGD